MSDFPLSNKKFPAWHEVEEQIQKEVNWLRRSIETFSKEEKYALIGCRECLMRRISVLIVSGVVKTTEINRSPELESFWKGNNQNNLKNVYHGSSWHRTTMEKIENHFRDQGCDVVCEPTLQWGRADLGVYKEGEKDLFIEIGTTSLFKLYINLKRMRNFIYLIVPNDDYLIEFIKD
jgi:hypothetical protein